MKNLLLLPVLLSIFGCTSKLMPKVNDDNNESQVRIQAITTTIYTYVEQDTTMEVKNERMVYDRNFKTSMDEIACKHRYSKDGEKLRSVTILSYRPFGLDALKSMISLDDFEENGKVIWKMDYKDKFTSRKLAQNYYTSTDKVELLYDRIDSFSVKKQLESSFYFTKDCPACVSWKRFYSYNEKGSFVDTTFYVKRMADSSFVKEFYTKFAYDERNRKIATYSLDTGHYTNDRWEENWSYSQDSLLYNKFKYNNYSGAKESMQTSISEFNKGQQLIHKVDYKKHFYLDTIVKMEEITIQRNSNEITETKQVYKFGSESKSNVGALEMTLNKITSLDSNGRVIKELEIAERIGWDRIDTILLINHFYHQDSDVLPSRYQVVKKLRQRFIEDYTFSFDTENRIVGYIGPNSKGAVIKKEIEYFPTTKEFLDLPRQIQQNIYPPHLDISIPKIKSITVSKKKNDQWQVVAVQEYIY